MIYSYIIWLFIFLGIPNIFMLLKYKKIVMKNIKNFVILVPGTLVVTGVWDYLAIQHYKVWFFPQANILGIWLLGIPLEEWIFMVSCYLFIFMLTAILSDEND